MSELFEASPYEENLGGLTRQEIIHGQSMEHNRAEVRRVLAEMAVLHTYYQELMADINGVPASPEKVEYIG